MLRSTPCRLGFLVAVGVAVPSHAQGPAPADAGDSTAAAIAADSTALLPDSARIGATPFRMPPPRPLDLGFLYDTKSVIDVERGIVRTVTRVGTVQVGPTEVQTLQEFVRASIVDQLDANLRQTRRRILAPPEGAEGGPILRMEFDIPSLPPLAKSIIGEGPSTLHISGYGRITMSGRTQYLSGKTTAGIRQSKFPTLAMQQELSFQIEGTIGSKIHVSIDQDTRRQTDLENSLLIRYQGEEDEVIQEIETGNTNLSIQGSQFVSGGGQHGGLFGIKTRARLGDLDLTMIASQQKSSSQKKTFRGGAQQSEVKIRDTEYLRNRFFFVDYSYREQYGKSLERLRQNPTETVLSIEINPVTQQPIWARKITKVLVYRGYLDYAGLSGVSKGWGVYARLTNPDGTDAVLPDSYDPDGLAQLKVQTNDETIWQGGWELMEEGRDYALVPSLGYIDFRTSLSEGTIIGVVITYVDQNGMERTFPQSTRSDWRVCKMLSYRGLSNDPTWGYRWRHVYFVGAQQIPANDFKLDIIHVTSQADFPQSRPDQTYLQIMGLDVAKASGTNLEEGSDRLVDINPAKVDLTAGLVMFPYLKPFDEALAGLKDEGNTSLYDQTKSIDARNTYQLVARYSKASTRISLGFGVLENSEVVTLDGERLRRGLDYTINYFIGEIQFTSERAQQVSDPGANLAIDYEVNPLFKPDQESLLGLSGVYSLGERGTLGGVFMYNSQRTSSQRVRVGEEPTRMAVFSTYGNYEFRPNWVTTAMDWLPLVETDEPSTLRLEGEIAQSLPNLNTRGVAYIDDFEGSNRLSPRSITRKSWSFASPPVDPVTSSERPRENKGRLVWFNPYDPIDPQDVFKRETLDIEEERQGVTVLNMWFRPNGNTAAERKESWGGVMQSMGDEGTNLTKTQFIELWVRADRTPFYPPRLNLKEPSGPVQGAKLHLDLGDVSENVLVSPGTLFLFSDLNSEDLITERKYVSETFQQFLNNSRLDTEDPTDQGEDVGLDGCPDRYEDGSGGCLPEVNPEYPAVTKDPNRDNWHLVPDRPSSVYQYESINGTESNSAEGLFPDDEDLNGDKQLQRRNAYYSYEIDLSGNSPYAVPGMSVAGSGFQLYRIPLKELDVPQVTRIGTEQPPFQFIKTFRLWVSGVEDTAIWVTIGSIDLVGNDWEEKKLEEEDFSVTTISTDNTDEYTLPPGVTQERDPYSGRPRREQSLVMQFDEIGPGQTYYAEKELQRSERYADYSRLRMYVHGPRSGIDPTWDHLAAFLRLGPDSTTYYELRIPRLYPGWDERNFVEVYLDSLTNLKLRPDGTTYTGLDTLSTDGKLRIVGSTRGLPSLTNVMILQLGVTNLSNHSIRSAKAIQVWFDELRLDGVRNIRGRASRASAQLRMADLANLQVSTAAKEIGFGGVTDKRGGTSESRSFSISVDRFRIDKFLPPTWRVSVPVNVSYSTLRNTPRLKGQSDIELVREQDKATERSSSETFSASTSYTKTSQSRNFITGMTLDRLNGGITYRLTRSVSPTPYQRDSARVVSYTARLAYDLTPRRPRQVGLLGWVPFAPDAVTGVQFAYLPTSLRFDASTTFTSDSTWRRTAVSGRDTVIVLGSTTFTLSEAYRVGFQPWRSFTTSYDLSISRDLKDEIEDDIGPSIVAQDVARSIFRKNEIQRSQSTSLGYNPPWPWWFSHSYSVTNRYADNSDRAITGITTGKRFNTSNSRSYSLSSYTLKVKDVFNRLGGAERAGAPGSQDKAGRSQRADSVRSFSPWKPLKATSRFLGSHLENITGRLSISEDFRGYQVPDSARPGLLYQVFGIGAHPNLAASTPGVLSQSSLGRQFGWDAGSGLELPFRMRLRGKYAYRTDRRFTAQDTSRSVDVTLPDLSYTWDGIESFPLLRSAMTRSGIESAFQRQTQERWRSTQSDKTIRSRTYRFSPLFSWSILWKNNIRTTVRSTWDRSYSNNANTEALDVSTNWSASFSTTYELQTSRGIKKPWGGVWKLAGNVNLSVDANLSGSKAIALKGNQTTGGDALKSHTMTWSVKPHASYQFSRTFSGQAQIEVGATKNYYLSQTTHIRGLSISGELRFD